LKPADTTADCTSSVVALLGQVSRPPQLSARQVQHCCGCCNLLQDTTGEVDADFALLDPRDILTKDLDELRQLVLEKKEKQAERQAGEWQHGLIACTSFDIDSARQPG
jgi:hypothetical protein